MPMTEISFSDKLEAGWQKGRSVCVGLDTDPARLPDELKRLETPDAIIEFHRRLIEATKHAALAYKPQSAAYEALGGDGPRVLLETIELIRQLAPDAVVILDAKRADIGSTNDFYIKAAFGYYGADAITLHPYLGLEAMQPFLDQKDKGMIILCRTSNPGAGRYQDLTVDGRPLYQHIAKDVAESWNSNGNCGLVVGATYPDEMREVRALVGDMPILVPGIGAQGGDVDATVSAGMMKGGRGLIISSSRGLMYAFQNGGSVEEATRAEFDKLNAQILEATQKL